MISMAEIWRKDREATEKMTRKLGQQYRKPVVGGSDTHQAVQYGCIRTRFEKTVNEVGELYREMQKGSYEICISDQAAFQVQTANLLKRSLKEIYALGGDYVSVLIGEGSRLDGSLPEISGMNMSKRGVSRNVFAVSKDTGKTDSGRTAYFGIY